MSPAQYAKAHGLSLNYVYRLIRKGRIASERVNGKLRYVIPAVAHVRLKPGPKKGE